MVPLEGRQEQQRLTRVIAKPAAPSLVRVGASANVFNVVHPT
jgi:hypothetical protein